MGKLSAPMKQRFEAIEHVQKDRDLQLKMKETQAVKLETEMQKAKMDQMRKQEEKRIEMETKILEQSKLAEIAKIVSDKEAKQLAVKSESQRLEQQKIADAQAYKSQKQIEGVEQMIQKGFGGKTEHYLEWHRQKAYWNSTNKVYYFGDSKDHLPKAFYGHGGHGHGQIGAQPATTSA